jgi:hypothetical protein
LRENSQQRQDLNRRAVELLHGQVKNWAEDIPLDAVHRPDFILSRVERWAKDAKMEVYQSIENGQNSITCAGSAVVLDMLFEKSGTGAGVPSVKLVSLKSSYPTSSESAPVTQPLTTVENMLASGINAYIDEVLYEEADAQKAAQLALRVIEHVRYIMLLDAQAAREAETGGTGARWFAEVGLLSPKVIDLGCKEATGLCRQVSPLLSRSSFSQSIQSVGKRQSPTRYIPAPRPRSPISQSKLAQHLLPGRCRSYRVP